MNNLTEKIVCSSAELIEKGNGVRFDLPELGERTTGFVIRYDGAPKAFVNRCAHVPVELDWNHGDFFDVTQNFIMCATHGAHYDPQTGYCVMGPCKGKSLQKIAVSEVNNQIMIHLNKSSI